MKEKEEGVGEGGKECVWGHAIVWMGMCLNVEFSGMMCKHMVK